MKDKLSRDEIRWLFGSLRRIDFFATATIQNIDQMIASFRKEKYPRGKVIIEEGTAGTALYIIRSGECLVYQQEGLFSQKEIAYLMEDEFFGEMSLVRNAPTSASVKTTKPSEIFVYDKKDFLILLSKNPGLRSHIDLIVQERLLFNEGKFEEAEQIRAHRLSMEEE